jgi:hypothetical protein
MYTGPSGPGIDVCLLCVLCVLLGRGLCDELITRPEESYRLWCVVVCDLETSFIRRSCTPPPSWGAVTSKKQTICYVCMKVSVYESMCVRPDIGICPIHRT